MRLTADNRAEWATNGWLVLRSLLDTETLCWLDASVRELEDWAESGGPGMHHREQTDLGPRLARSERFVDSHAGLDAFIRHGVIADVLEQLFDDAPVLFKEKVNYKYPGGGGYAPHQDATAYRFVDHHISVMVPIDPSTRASGCLWFAPGHRGGAMPTDTRGRITEDHAATLDWRPVEVAHGDLVFFDSYAPHHSDTNTSGQPRRAFYLTYNAASLGDHRERYYADKAAEFAREGDTFGDQRVRISISDDFLGRPVDPDT